MPSLHLDSCIEALVVRGALAMASFLRGESAGVGSEMAWVERKQSSKSFDSDKKPASRSLSAALPLLVGGSFAMAAGLFGLFLRSDGSSHSSREHYSRVARQVVLQPVMLLFSIVRSSVQLTSGRAV